MIAIKHRIIRRLYSLKQAISQESVSDSGHSYSSTESEQNSASKVKSAAMLGIALSVGASGALVATAEASAAVSAPTVSDTTKAFSSEFKASSSESSQAQIVAYHTVASGESLWQIAQQHRVGLQDLKVANELPPETSIRVGQVLRVPGNNPGIEIEIASVPTVPTPTVPTVDKTAQLTEEEAGATDEDSTSAPALIAQSIEVDSQAQPGAEALRLDGVGGTAPSIETTEQAPSIEIQIADASSQISPQAESAPVVTALAAPQTFSNYQIQAGDTLASIASSLGTTPQDIVRANGLSNPNVIITGATLRVPTLHQATLSRGGATPAPAVEAAPRRDIPESQRLAYLQSTATRPEGSRLLEEIRVNAPTNPASVGGQVVTQQDVIGSDTSEELQSADPYVANLLEDVQAVRENDVQTSEVATEVIESDSERPSLMARAVSQEDGQRISEDIAIAPAVPEADAELLAAAPLSPDAYIPAQRPAAGQVVSPDMPLLPGSEEFLPEAPESFNGYVWPAQGTLTSGYGWRWGRMHRGVDVAGPVGTPIVAAAMGVVEQAGWNSGGYGNMVEIRHPDGSLTRYAHNNRLNVSEGQRVSQGQKIAEMGSTGYSTGPHLHFEVHMSGQGAVNPVAYLPGR